LKITADLFYLENYPIRNRIPGFRIEDEEKDEVKEEKKTKKSQRGTIPQVQVFLENALSKPFLLLNPFQACFWRKIFLSNNRKGGGSSFQS